MAGYTVMDMLNQQSRAGIDDSPKARFRTKDISISKMYRNKMNFYKVEDIESLARDIQEHGLKQNLEVVYEPCEDGEYRIISGERRWEALKILVSEGLAKFEIATCRIVKPRDPDEEQIEIISANSYRTKSISDNLEEVKRLKLAVENIRKREGQIEGYDLKNKKTRDIVAGMMGTSSTRVAQMECINNNLIQELREAADENKIDFSAAYELSGMEESAQREMLALYKESGSLTHKEVKTIKGKMAAVRPNLDKAESVPEPYAEPEPVPEKVSESDTGKYMSYEDAAVTYGMDAQEESETDPEGEVCSEFEGYSCNIEETIKKHFLKGGYIEGCAGCCRFCKDKEKCEYTCDAVLLQIGRKKGPERQQTNNKEHRPGDDYEDPHPESITSLCYSCKRYSDCNVKTGTCRKCDQYINKTEAEKTEEQRYSEEQDRIDRKTRKRLREMEDEEKMKHLPSDRRDAKEPQDKQEAGSRTHKMRLTVRYFDAVCNGSKSFELRKNDREYKVGDILEMEEYGGGGVGTGRAVKAVITYILEGYTGLEDGYCILSIKIISGGFYWIEG
ncbi:MAG: DUF3850 domain-containing protein [Lachnospiraceae bacterium]